ncbi:uncharacterized protein LOC123526342 isoform X1 [Mercenaria mercenaria]|uniref:uncharacterized protein LOC123526342 isoform X1 n=1 Tax=Mercenaria mercenaria TaxID=6596 RepID=UPI00234F898D|nr:uncharacterized protein LOC123526342 isoform X1 [Mercenaria mercenaria]XP_053378891.1 uncharacterized protein LOC123526342 isoform X1 [Mercenaria mercenaria]XP_053378892.1 uncharacterized protein LOC123526342 isoform X1 [Mercenaria mercenaria]
MAALVQTTETKGFQNWLRGALAVLFAKQGLQSFVVDELTQFQRDLLTLIFKNNNLPTGTRVCTNCTTENVLKCRTHNFCPKGRQCNMHDASVPDKTPKPCPNNICHAVKDAIRREHRYNGPSWKNANAKGWCTDVTEIAKCYMPDGYTNVTTITDTDFNGILAVILNNKRFKSKMTAPLNSPVNVCTEAREVSRVIRHSADLTISDTDLAKYIDILIRLLSDPAYLAADQNAKTAVDKLNQLKTNTLTITSGDIITVLDSTLKDIIEKQRDNVVQDVSEERRKAKEDIEDKKIQAIKQLLGNVKASLNNMQTVTTSSLDKIIESKQSALNEIQVKAENERQELAALSTREQQRIKEAVDRESDEFRNVAEKEAQDIITLSKREKQIITDEAGKEIDKIMSVAEKEKQELTAISERQKQSIKDEAGKETVSCPPQLKVSEIITTEDRQKELEKSLREDLLNYYRQCYNTIPIAPLAEEHDVELVDFYVQPPLTAIDIEKTFGQLPATPARTAVHSYRDLFLGSDYKLHKNIYVTAKAGIGKTSFVKKICMTWCQAHRPLEKIKQKFKPDDVHVMKQFEYLFVISLRDTNTSICDIDGMINSQIIDSLAGAHRYSEYFVKEILLHSTCLVILDGLDEWSHPASCRRGCSNVHEMHIPHRPARERCSVLTTTRAWKLDVAKLRTNQIDRHVEITELDTSASDQLISNALTVLNKRNLQNESKTIKEFHAATDSLQIKIIRYIPYVLLQMVCLWFDGKSIGKSKCEIYSNVIDLTLTRGLMKCREYVSCLEGNDADIPFCLRSTECCKTFYSELLRLGVIAFQTLFALEEESSLVFDKTVIRNFVSDQMLGFYLKVGLLSQNKAYGRVAVRQSSFSFQHKSIQEYFAALYIQAEYDSEEILQKISNKCNTLAAILEMSNVFTFLGGLKPDACAKILQSLQSTRSSDWTAHIYRNQGSKYIFYEYVNVSDTLKTLQSMYTDIVNEVLNNGLKYVPPFLEDILLDNAIDKKTYPLLKLLIKKNKSNIKSLCIKGCQTTEEFTGILYSLGLQDIQSLHKLDIQAIPRQQELLRLLSGSVHTLTCLCLTFAPFKNNAHYRAYKNTFTETMKTILSMDQLLSLELAGVCITHFYMKALFSFITKKTAMTEIALDNIKCTDHKAECTGYCLDLSKHRKLKVLRLNDIVISNLQVNTSSLKTFWLGQLPVDDYSSLLKDLQHATCLRMMFIKLTQGLLRHLTDILPKLENLKLLIIYNSNLRDKSFTVPIEMTSIEVVWFCQVTMTSTALRKLIASIDMLPQSVTISLMACTVIQQEEYEQIKDEIKVSTQYKVMYDGLDQDNTYRFAFQTVGQNLRQST